MANFNRVILMGRLTRDPELRYSGGGTAVCKLSLAINRRVKRGDNWEEEAHFFDAVAFGSRGEALAKYLGKGDPVLLEGELVQNRWENQQGEKRSKVEVHVNNFSFVGGRGDSPRRADSGGSSQSPHGQEGPPPAFEDDDIPF